MYTIKYTRSFEKDFKRCKQRGYEMEALNEVMQLLEKDGTLPSKYKPHKLSVNSTAVGNAISSPIGCLFGTRTKPNW